MSKEESLNSFESDFEGEEEEEEYSDVDYDDIMDKADKCYNKLTKQSK